MSELLRKYAKLAVNVGVNLQKDQLLVIGCQIENAEFARLCMEEAFIAGAKDVVMNWGCEKSEKLRFERADISVFEKLYSFKKDLPLSMSKMGAAFLNIAGGDPDIFKDIDPVKMQTSLKTSRVELKEFYDATMTNKNRWTVLCIPTISWAKKVFPGENSNEKALEKLWEAIFATTRLYETDSVAAWKKQQEILTAKSKILNGYNLKSVHLKNSLGTDLLVELPEGHIWSGGGDIAQDGVAFMPNIPTEEIFTLPKRNGVNGIVHSTKPLSYNGKLFEDFSFTFKDGKITDFTAKKGYDTLKLLLDSDEGARHLGEIALVPHDSPISKSGLIFFNTLFDENASCHLALGRAYTPCIKGGEKLSESELLEKGVNNSLIHVDFMVGSGDLEISGLCADGKKVSIFKDGNWDT